MTAIGGSLESVSIDGRNFPVTADAEVQRKIGGFENEVISNGDGGARLIKTRVPMMLEGLVVEVDDSRGDHEFLQSLADSSQFFAVALTYASGQVWQGTAQIVDQLQAASQSTSATISLSGPGALTRQQ